MIDVHQFKCPVCQTQSVLADNMMKQVIFICQHCGFREVVQHHYKAHKAPYYFISGQTVGLPDMLGKN
jgi:transcription elongation factor Elf1